MVIALTSHLLLVGAALSEAVMEHQQPFHARSGDVLIEGDVAVLSFLTSIDGQPNVSVSMKTHVLESLHLRIMRALNERQQQIPRQLTVRRGSLRGNRRGLSAAVREAMPTGGLAQWGGASSIVQIEETCVGNRRPRGLIVPPA